MTRSSLLNREISFPASTRGRSASSVEQFAALIEPQRPAELQALERDEAQLAAKAKVSDRERAELQLSVAYQNRKLVAALTSIVNALDCVIDTNRIATEMSCWATTSLLLGGEESLRLALWVCRIATLIGSPRAD